MTPQEKAIELVNKFNYDLEPFSDFGKWNKEQAKHCTLIAVDEILDSHYKLLSGVKTSIYKYWQEVKQEIEKL